MKIKASEYNPFIWNKWFAWYPVTIGNNWHWLEYVERKYTFHPTRPLRLITSVEYRILNG